MSAWTEDWERSRVLHGEDEVEDVWGGEFGASTAVWLVSHVGAHCGYFELIRPNDTLSLSMKADVIRSQPVRVREGKRVNNESRRDQ